jgi:kinesin family protein 4/21/27
VIRTFDGKKEFAFDNVFSDEVDQETFYEETVKRLVEGLFKGLNATVFAYGQTGNDLFACHIEQALEIRFIIIIIIYYFYLK